MGHHWLSITRVDLETELLQSTQEGRDMALLKREFDRLFGADLRLPENQAAAERLLDSVQASPRAEVDDVVQGVPNELAIVQDLAQKLHNAWLGRCCGCLLGKPVEGWSRAQIKALLEDTGQAPLANYIASNNIKPSRESISCMPEDDDLNYTICGLAIVEKHGRLATSEQIADFWLQNIPLLHTCTAERVAYKNLVNGIRPPLSATHRNPYREWIGAQIRADFWGYCNPGNPTAAAEMAFRDAQISHVANGIYGAQWAAAMVAIAFVEDDPRQIVERALAAIPLNCRLAKGIHQVLQSKTAHDCLVGIHSRWNESRAHDWCHVISNAEVVTMALIHGGADFERSICMAVEAGFDTDCNGATVGSILGAAGRAIAEKWSRPINDTLETGVQGFHRVKISEVAERTLRLVQSHE